MPGHTRGAPPSSSPWAAGARRAACPASCAVATLGWRSPRPTRPSPCGRGTWTVRVRGGKRAVVETVVAALIARGHVLLEDVPGVGKTVLARALARSVEADFRRVQCTPDLLPSDVTGTSIFNLRDQTFEFRRRPVFTNLLLADEVNRATPRTH